MLTKPASERHVKSLHEHLADVAAHPLVEDGCEESSELFSGYRAFCNLRAVLQIQRAVGAGPLAPAQVRQRDHRLGGPLNNGYELHVTGLHFVAKESIDIERMLGIGGVNGAKDIDIHLVLAQQPVALHDVTETADAALIDAVGIVHGLRTIDAQADQHVMQFEERAPFVIQKRAVRLDGVLNVLPGLAMSLDVLNGTAEELDPHE